MKVHASLFPRILGHDALYYVPSRMYTPYDVVFLCVMIIRIRLKGNLLRELMFFKPLKIEAMH